MIIFIFFAMIFLCLIFTCLYRMSLLANRATNVPRETIVESFHKVTSGAFILFIFACANIANAETKILIPSITQFVIDIPRRDSHLLPKWARVIDSGELHSYSTRTPVFEDLKAVQQNASLFSYKLNPDKWQTPSELEGSQEGDCKDIAVWKYKKLRDRGWKAKDMNLWIVGLKPIEGQLAGFVMHMVLVVKLDGEEWLLNSPEDWDGSYIPRPIHATSEYMHSHFDFLYRINENGWSID